ncbi:MAG: imidazoleglycerol-phosphate dehydratase [Dehalococcoidales bacterium]|nr:imidazoleglycerol-phosphate dehydratase [Dehalococcoidales bacterium]
MVSVNEVLGKIVHLQQEHGYSDAQMAQKIGCSRPLYQRTRSGKVAVGGKFLKGALKLLEEVYPQSLRRASLNRETAETNVSVEVELDGTGRWVIDTGVHILDHFLSQIARHGLLDIKINAGGDDVHHLVEDVAISLGRAFLGALGDGKGIVRMASAIVPMDEALAMVAVDLGGRGYAVLDLKLSGTGDISGLPCDLIRHFLETLAVESRMNLHAQVFYGSSDHHKAEAVFKALGRALGGAVRVEARSGGEVPSTKGVLER